MFIAVVAVFDTIVLPIIPLYFGYHLYGLIRGVATAYVYKHIAAAALAYYTFGLALCILTAIVKHTVRVILGAKNSSHTVDLLLNWTFPRFPVMMSGGPGMAVYLKLFGAKIGSILSVKVWFLQMYSDPSSMNFKSGCTVLPFARIGRFSTAVAQSCEHMTSAKQADIELGNAAAIAARRLSKPTTTTTTAATATAAVTTAAAGVSDKKALVAAASGSSVISVGKQSIVGSLGYIGTAGCCEDDTTLAPLTYITADKHGKLHVTRQYTCTCSSMCLHCDTALL
jgi:hypothetical protein